MDGLKRAFGSLWIDDEYAEILLAYLKAHKQDIEAGINDFGDLQPLLILLAVDRPA